MVEKRFRKALGCCLALALCLNMAGCSSLDQAARQLEQLWEEEASDAVGRQDDLPTASQDGNTQGNSITQEDGVQEGGNAQADQAKEAVPEKAAQDSSFANAQADHYAYDTLTETEQVWYRNIARILGRMQEKQELSVNGIKGGLDETCIDKIFQCVLNDHPEFFYVEGYTYTKFTRLDKLVKLEFSGTYSMEPEEAGERMQQIESAAGEILSGISTDASDYDKVKYVYETLIRNTEYDLAASDNQNIYSVFVGRRSVCQGYAKATQYLLNRLGMECTMVMGTVDTGEGHAWNLVKVDGEYYYVDTTWGDASYQMEESAAQGEDEEKRLPDINYDYLCVTTRQLLRTHTLGGVVPMPSCTAVRANYYVREGSYFISYDMEQMEQVFIRAGEQGRSEVTLKCADRNVYDEIDQALIEDQKIFEYLGTGSGTVAYAQNEKQLSMTFWMTNP